MTENHSTENLAVTNEEIFTLMREYSQDLLALCNRPLKQIDPTTVDTIVCRLQMLNTELMLRHTLTPR